LISCATGVELASFEGRAAADWFGARVAAAGDVDRDGRPDLLVGAPGHDDEPSKPGYAQVLSTGHLPRRADDRPLLGPSKR
jgi:hypothetical protein